MPKDYTIIIPSNKPDKLQATLDFLLSFEIEPVHKNGAGYPSFAKLINDCVVECPTEIVIICNDKARPTSKQLDKMLGLISDGFGFVGLYCFGFFGFSKELFRQVGPLDERFLGGNYEDCDFLRRLNEANIACYMAYEIVYHEVQHSSWIQGFSEIHYHNKWIDATPDNLICIRKLNEENYNYDFGPNIERNFLPWDKSHLPDSEWFLNAKIVSQVNK